MHIQVRGDPKFQLKLTILIFWTKFAQKEYFQYQINKKKKKKKKKKIEKAKKNHHQILHIRIITFCTEFHIKLIILIFWIKFFPKGFFWSQTEKLDITIDFCIFKLV